MVVILTRQDAPLRGFFHTIKFFRVLTEEALHHPFARACNVIDGEVSGFHIN